ncbi:MAG: hypothetical protein ACYC2Y_04065 [Armatimonadota bacterium]
MKVLAIDPGSAKCGLAVVADRVLYREIVEREHVLQAVRTLAPNVDRVIIGNGTGSVGLIEGLRAAGIETEQVDEAFSSEKARRRFLRENPPQGLRRLIPGWLRVPDRPYDDYVAVILAEEYLRR